MKKLILALLVILSVTVNSCREEQTIFLSDSQGVTPPEETELYSGFYLLNEGNMGMNRASIDMFEYHSGKYTTDIFSERNPSITNELGDVGNDIQIYGSKAYATINVSNFIEVFDVPTGKHIAQIHVPNCRYLSFNNGKAYVSSYSGKVEINPNAEKGFVAEIDTLFLTITRRVEVGYQPEQMVVHKNKLYVANSGGYRVPNYDTTISVIDLDSFTEIKKIEVAPNLHRMQIDNNGDIYVNSRGDYYNLQPNLHVVDTKEDKLKQTLNIPVSNMVYFENKLYYYATPFNYQTGQGKPTYGILDTNTKQVLQTSIITDGSEKNILIPYGLAINPENKDIIITDAQDYVGTGYVLCYNAQGKLKWRTTAGNIPAHVAFIPIKKR
ncbi:YncE family protein [Myroides sp. LJL119]